MIENISKKQKKIQEKIQKQQNLNDKDCRELTDEELEQIVGGLRPQDQKNPVVTKVTSAPESGAPIAAP